MRKPPPILPVLAVLAGASLGASSGLYIKQVRLSSLALTGFRMGIPLLAMLPLMIRRGGLLGERSSRRGLWLASALNALRMSLFVTAYKLTSVGNAVVVFYVWPLLAMLIDGIRARRRPTAAQAGLLALASAGVLLMNLRRGLSVSAAELRGCLLMLAAAAVFATTSILFKKALAEVRETDALYFQNAIGALVFLPFLALELPGAGASDLLLAALYGLSVGLAAFWLFFFGMKRLPLFQYSALTYAEVLVAVLLGVAVLGEGLDASRVLGALMVVAASLLAQRLREAPAGEEPAR